MLALPVNSRKHLFTEDFEDGEMPDVDIVGKFKDGYDENLIGDDADRLRLEGLSDLERESELYDRSVKREEQMIKWGIKNMLMEKNNSESVSEVAVAVKERSNLRRLHLEAQPGANKKRGAFNRLVAQRNNKRSRCDEEIIINHITADEDEEEQQQQQQQEQDQELNLNGVDFPCRKLILKTQDIYSDDSSSCTDDENYMYHNESDELVETLAELENAVLTRNQLEDFLEKPIFEKTVIGCFVRVSIGEVLDEQSSIYKLSEIVALETIDQEYQMGSHRTKRVLQLKHGAYLHSFLMNVVSNQPVTSSEFSHFLEAWQRDAQSLPSIGRISEKQKDIEKATNYAFTEGDVELIVQTKRKAGQKLVSAAYRKVRLIMERDLAIESNDAKKANELERVINQIDEQSLTEPQREKRVQYMSSKTAPTPAQPSLTRNKSGLKQEQDTTTSEELLSDFLADPEHKTNECKELTTSEAQQINLKNIDKLDLHELYNFRITLDLSNLLKFNAIFSETESRYLL